MIATQVFRRMQGWWVKLETIAEIQSIPPPSPSPSPSSFPLCPVLSLEKTSERYSKTWAIILFHVDNTLISNYDGIFFMSNYIQLKGKLLQHQNFAKRNIPKKVGCPKLAEFMSSQLLRIAHAWSRILMSALKWLFSRHWCRVHIEDMKSNFDNAILCRFWDWIWRHFILICNNV